MAHYFPYDVKLQLLADSRSFLANQKARNAIVGAENLLNCYNFKYSFVIIPREHRPQHRVQLDTNKNDRRSFCSALAVHDSYLQYSLNRISRAILVETDQLCTTPQRK